MNTFAAFLQAEWTERVGWTLLHSLWQIAAVAAVYAIAAFLLRGRSANARYLLGCTAILAMLGLPVGTYLLLPQAATLDIEEASSVHGAFALPGESPESLPTGSLESLPVELSDLPGEPTQPMSDSGTVVTVPSVVAAEQPATTDLRSEMRRYMPWATAVWLAGVVVLSLRPLFGWLHVHRLRRRGLSPLSEPLLEVGRRVQQRLGVRRAVALVESALVEVPSVIGSLRPMILLPASALTGLSTAELELIFAHELAHVRRHDWLVNLVQTVIEALLFYHPAMWWVTHQIRKERENCCDDLAVGVGGSRAVYAQALTRLEEQRSARPAAVLAATGGSLVTRIRRLLGQPTEGCSYRHATAWLAGLVTIGFVIMALAMNPTAGVTVAEAGEETEDDVASKIGFDTVSVSFSDPMGPRAPEHITIHADGSCVYKIDEVPARGQSEAWPSARQTFQLGQRRLRQLNGLLEKTGWFAVPASELPAPPGMSATKITMVRNGQTLSVTCHRHDRAPAPYASLLWFLSGVAHQENLLYQIANLPSKQAWHAWDTIGSDVRAKRGISGRGQPIYDIDYTRYLPTCSTVVRDPSAYHYEQVIAAIRLIAFLRAQSEFDHIAAMSNDSNSSVRRAAAKALTDIGGERAVPTLAKMAGNTEEAIWGMIRLGDVAVPTLVEMVRKTDSNEDIGLSTRIVRAYMDHWNELPRPVDERVVAAARNEEFLRKFEGRYHAAFLDLIDSRPIPAEGLSCRIDQHRVYCPKPMLFVHGWYMVAYGKIVQHVAAWTPPVDTTVFDLKFEVATDGGRPIFRVGWLPPPGPAGEQAQLVARGTVLDVPKESHLEVVYDYRRDKPRLANRVSPLRVAGQYRTLWEGQFVKDGIALKRIVYIARVVAPDERDWEFEPPSAPAVSMAAPRKTPR